MDLPPRERLLDRVHRLVEPHALGAGSRARVERPRLRRSGTRTPSRRWRRSSRATGRAATSSPTTPTEFARRTQELAPTGRHAAQPDRDRASPVPGGAARADRARSPPGSPSQPARRRDRDGQDSDGGGRLRAASGRRSAASRLLFVAHREEILEQSRATFRHALRDASFGEMWVGGQRPDALRARLRLDPEPAPRRRSRHIDPTHFDVVIVDEFHHAAAPSYEALLEHLKPIELLGLTATPERADGLDVLRYFDGRIAAELRLWDAIDQQYLAPFAYFGVHDGLDLRSVPWRRGQGYDIAALDERLHRRPRVGAAGGRGDPAEDRRSVERCGRSASASASATPASWPQRFTRARPPGRRPLGGESSRASAGPRCATSPTATSRVVFTVDLFNEGVDIPTVDTLLLLRPTDSPTLFLQQLGRGLRKAAGKSACTVLDFVGTHRKEFRFDRRLRALLGGSRADVERQVRQDFPFLPAGCSFQLDPVAQGDRARAASAPRSRARGASGARSFARSAMSGSASTSRAAASSSRTSTPAATAGRRCVARRGLAHRAGGTSEAALLRAVGRLLHVDDDERLEAYPRLLGARLSAVPRRRSARASSGSSACSSRRSRA